MSRHKRVRGQRGGRDHLVRPTEDHRGYRAAQRLAASGPQGRGRPLGGGRHGAGTATCGCRMTVPAPSGTRWSMARAGAAVDRTPSPPARIRRPRVDRRQPAQLAGPRRRAEGGDRRVAGAVRLGQAADLQRPDRPAHRRARPPPAGRRPGRPRRPDRDRRLGRVQRAVDPRHARPDRHHGRRRPDRLPVLLDQLDTTGAELQGLLPPTAEGMGLFDGLNEEAEAYAAEAIPPPEDVAKGEAEAAPAEGPGPPADSIFPSDNPWGVPTLLMSHQAEAVVFPVTAWGSVVPADKMTGTWACSTSTTGRFEPLCATRAGSCSRAPRPSSSPISPPTISTPAPSRSGRSTASAGSPAGGSPRGCACSST